MNRNMYEKFSQDFLAIRDLSFSKVSLDQGIITLKAKMDSLTTMRTQIINQADNEEKEILLYCIDTLLDLIEKKDFTTIHDFCNAVHNIGLFLYVPRWNDGPTWSKKDYYDVYIYPFRQKYGRVFFSEIINYFKNPEDTFKRAKIKKSLMNLMPQKKKSVVENKRITDKPGNKNQ